MSFLRPIQLYHSQADPIWPDGTFKSLPDNQKKCLPPAVLTKIQRD